MSLKKQSIMMLVIAGVFAVMLATKWPSEIVMLHSLSTGAVAGCFMPLLGRGALGRAPHDERERLIIRRSSGFSSGVFVGILTLGNMAYARFLDPSIPAEFVDWQSKALPYLVSIGFLAMMASYAAATLYNLRQPLDSESS